MRSFLHIERPRQIVNHDQFIAHDPVVALLEVDPELRVIVEEIRSRALHQLAS